MIKALPHNIFLKASMIAYKNCEHFPMKIIEKFDHLIDERDVFVIIR
jgi:hypothetical protein